MVIATQKMLTTVGIQSSQDEQPATPTHIRFSSPPRESPDKVSQRLLQFTSTDGKSPHNPLESVSFSQISQSPVNPKLNFLLAGTARSGKRTGSMRFQHKEQELDVDCMAVRAYRAIRSISSIPSSVTAFRSGCNLLNRLIVRQRKETKADIDLRLNRRKVTAVRLDSRSHLHIKSPDPRPLPKIVSEVHLHRSHVRRKSAPKRHMQAPLSVVNLTPPRVGSGEGWLASDLSAVLYARGR